MRVGVLGGGPLGRAVADPLARGDVAGCELAGTVTSRSPADDRIALREAAVVVEAAGVPAVAERVPELLEHGCTVVLCSCAALADPGVADTLGRSGPGRVLVPAGALGGLDLAVAAVRGDHTASVRLTTTKSPTALAAGAAGEVFRGTARDAALAFPRTANVAAALALVTVGLDATEVVVRADPDVVRTRHEVVVDGRLGRHRLVTENAVVEGSAGRTSALTAWSVVVLLEALASGRPALAAHRLPNPAAVITP